MTLNEGQGPRTGNIDLCSAKDGEDKNIDL